MAGISKAERARRADAAKPDAWTGAYEAFDARLSDCARAEWLAVASHAVPAVLADMRARVRPGATAPDVWQAVDAVIAEADRRWPR